MKYINLKFLFIQKKNIIECKTINGILLNKLMPHHFKKKIKNKNNIIMYLKIY